LAEWFRDHGIAAFVLKYRLAREKGSTYTVAEHAMAHTRRAIRLVRSRAGEWEPGAQTVPIRASRSNYSPMQYRISSHFGAVCWATRK
jgi:hypothetical protein